MVVPQTHSTLSRRGTSAGEPDRVDVPLSAVLLVSAQLDKGGAARRATPTRHEDRRDAGEEETAVLFAWGAVTCRRGRYRMGVKRPFPNFETNGARTTAVRTLSEVNATTRDVVFTV